MSEVPICSDAKNPLVQSAISIVEKQHYISFRALCRKLGMEKDSRKLLDAIRTECQDVNSGIGEIDEPEAKKSLLQLKVFYSKNWARKVQWPQSIGLKIGYNLYAQILENNWNNYGTSHGVNIGSLYNAYRDNVIMWQMGFAGYHYAWNEFSRFYGSLDNLAEFECELGEDEIITRFIPNVDAEALKHLEPSGIIRSNATVNPGDILVGKMRLRGKSREPIFFDAEPRICDKSLRVPVGISGMVSEVHLEQRRGLPAYRVAMTRKIEKLLKERMAEVLLGEEMTVDIMDSETQNCLVTANTRITKTHINRIVKHRDHVLINDVNMMERVAAIFREFHPYFDALASDVIGIKKVRVSLMKRTLV